MAAPQSSTSVTKWNRATKHVEDTIRSGRYINGETTLIIAGPPRLADLAGASVNLNGQTTAAGALGGGTNGRDAFYPIGLLESVSIQQAQNVQKLFEIGSRRSYQAAGRVQVVASLGRVVFKGPSLLRALYAYYPNAVAMAGGKALSADQGGTQDGVVSTIVNAALKPAFPEIFFEAGGFSAPDRESADGKPTAAYFNLMSELFSHPFGLGVIMRDNNNDNYAAHYLEDCFVSSHSFQIGASSTLVSEMVNLQADAWVPLEFSTEVGAQIGALLGR